MRSILRYVAFLAAAFVSVGSNAANENKVANAFDGSFFVTQVEWAQFGCQDDSTQFWERPFVDFPTFVFDVFRNSSIENNASTSIRSVTYVAESLGGVISIPAYEMFQQEMTQNGEATAVQLREPEGNFPITIDPTGALSVPDAPPGVTIQGQMSADGTLFTFLAVGTFFETNGSLTCTDTFTTTGWGISREVK